MFKRFYTPIFLNIFAVIVAVSLIFLVFNYNAKHSEAQTANVLNFGGKITKVEYCCTGFAILVSLPKPGWLLVNAQSKIYAWYNIYRAGAYTIGTYKPVGICKTATSLCKLPLPMMGTVVQVGTSGL